MDKIGSNKKNMVKVEWSFSLFILLRPHSVVAHSRYKSTSIKQGQISLAWRQPRMWEKSDSHLVTLRLKPNQQQLPMRHCSRLPLKSMSWFQPADDAGIQSATDNARIQLAADNARIQLATDNAGTLPAFQLKSRFLGYSESLSKHLLRRHNAADTTTSLSI